MFGPWQKRVRVRPLSVKLICFRSFRREQLKLLRRPILRTLMLLRVRVFAEQPPIGAVQALSLVTESVLRVAAIG